MVTYQTKNDQDLFSKINFLYANAAASVKTGIGVKSEGELIITGTKRIYLCTVTVVENRLF